MAISTILWKISVWPLCLLSMLLQVGCSIGVHNGVSSSYSTEVQQYIQLGYLKHNNPWRDVWPMITFDNGVTIKIHPAFWHSFTHNITQCTEDYSEFFFQMWSGENILFDVKNSYFLSFDGEKVAISEVQIAEENTLLYPMPSLTDGISMMPSIYSAEELHALWMNGNYNAMRQDPARYYLKVTTQQKVGCAFDYYRLYLSFKDVSSGEATGYWLYFFPVEYKTFSR